MNEIKIQTIKTSTYLEQLKESYKGINASQEHTILDVLLHNLSIETEVLWLDKTKKELRRVDVMKRCKLSKFQALTIINHILKDVNYDELETFRSRKDKPNVILTHRIELHKDVLFQQEVRLKDGTTEFQLFSKFPREKMEKNDNIKVGGLVGFAGQFGIVKKVNCNRFGQFEIEIIGGPIMHVARNHDFIVYESENEDEDYY